MCLDLDLIFVVVTVMMEMDEDEDDARVSLGSLHWLGTSLGRPGSPQTLRDPPPCASRMMGLKVCPTTSGYILSFILWFFTLLLALCCCLVRLGAELSSGLSAY